MRPFVTIARSLVFATALVGTSIAADAPKEKSIFKTGPTTAELKAKNVEGENWEGPHVAEIKSFADWDRTFAASNDEPILIFKHSTECPVNAKAAYRINAWLQANDAGAPKVVFVKVIESKPVSERIEEQLAVEHESPQIILVRDQKAVWSTSHDEITAEAIQNALAPSAEPKTSVEPKISIEP